uniref:SH3 domain-containing protein n=1 Tax=Salarias fasciatus TaxID=181472 RepID=A0A672GPV6_SALFA
IRHVCGDKDADGFYHGESGGLSGYVPGNMVAEIPVDDEYLKQLLLQQGFLPVDPEGTDPGSRSPPGSRWPPSPRTWWSVEWWPCSTTIPGKVRPTWTAKYVSAFHWMLFPWQVELGFRAGEIIYVLGDMDRDGFYYGDLHGRRGLVPSNFLQLLPPTRFFFHFPLQPTVHSSINAFYFMGDNTVHQSPPGAPPLNTLRFNADFHRSDQTTQTPTSFPRIKTAQ